MAAITQADITIRGSVDSRVVSLKINNVTVTIAADKTFAYPLTAPIDSLLTLTTIDNQGLSESRPMRITTTDQAYVPVPFMPTAPA